MKENQEKLGATLELFKPFLEGNNLSTEMSDYLETVYYVPREKMQPNKKNDYTFDEFKVFPNNLSKSSGYFVAEFWFPYVNNIIRTDCNAFVFSHVFKLDYTHIKDEFERLGRLNDLKIQIDLDTLVHGIRMYYHLIHEFTVGKNDKMDCNKIAEILFEKWNLINSDKNYGI